MKEKSGKIVGPVLVLAVILVALVPGFQRDALGAAPVASKDPEVMPVPVEVAGLGGTEAWWGAVQSYIRRDLAQAEGTRWLDGLDTDPGWERPGESGPASHFGSSIASAGDVNGDGLADIIVGAFTFDGSRGKAYAFYQTASGLETTPNWTATGAQPLDEFGCSVAGAGDVNGDGYSDVIVGASKYPGGDAQGRAYVFLGGQSGLDNSPIAPLDGENDDDEFGGSVAGAGDVNGDGYADVIVGAQGFDDDGALEAGKAYLYLGGASGPGNHGERSLTGDAAGAKFGSAVAGAGDVDSDGYADVLIGAAGTNASAGAVHVYYGSERGFDKQRDWSYNGGLNDELGTAVAAAGDVNGDGYADIIFGAEHYRDEASSTWTLGRVWVFHGGANGLRPTVWDWTRLGLSDWDRYGASVAGAGDVNGDGYADVLIGAPGFGASNHGKAYLHLGSENGVVDNPAWEDEGENNWDTYGSAVAGAGDVNGDGYADVAVSAEGFASGASRGKAYVYYGAGDLPSMPTADWSESGETSGDHFSRVAGAGDVNGDGYADVVVGACLINGGQGRVYVYLGSADGLPSFPDWDDDGEQAGSWFGRWVAGAGDVNGDGYGDVLVGAFGYDTSSDPSDADAGRAYLYYGGADDLSADPIVVGTGEAGDDHYGLRVAGAGDVNGDGYADIMVSSDHHNVGTGKVYVYHGSEDGPSPIADRELEGAAHYEYFGYSIAGAGDLNGDGYADVVVGAYGAPGGDFGGQDKGEVKIFTGSATGLGTGVAWTLEGQSDGDQFGYSVAGAGDVNGDGYSDVVVGAPYFATNDRGMVYLYDFTAAGVTTNATWSTMGPWVQSDHFGTSVAGAGDVNGDGFADLLVGADQDDGGDDRSYAVVFLGPRSGGSFLVGEWTVEAEGAGDAFGVVVAGGGDVNGDGYADVLVASETGGGNAGKIYAYFGNDGGGRRVLARQSGSDGMQIQPWGLADAPDEFRVSMWASDPAGRGRLKLEVEGCPPGNSFGDDDCLSAVSSVWQDLFPSAGHATQARIVTRVAGLEDLTLYRWRARVLYAPFTVNKTGITPPPKPAHSPWRRFLGQGMEADLRTGPCSYGLEVSPPRDTESGSPGESVFYTLRLTNTGTCQDTADVTVGPVAWTTDLPSTVGPLTPHGSSAVHVTVDIPAEAAGDDSDKATIIFTSQADPDESASSELTTRVLGWEVYLPSVLKDWP